MICMLHFQGLCRTCVQANALSVRLTLLPQAMHTAILISVGTATVAVLNWLFDTTVCLHADNTWMWGSDFLITYDICAGRCAYIH